MKKNKKRKNSVKIKKGGLKKRYNRKKLERAIKRKKESEKKQQDVVGTAKPSLVKRIILAIRKAWRFVLRFTICKVRIHSWIVSKKGNVICERCPLVLPYEPVEGKQKDLLDKVKRMRYE